jgi:uncharacterized repeat protein (TIGR01451 family)
MKKLSLLAATVTFVLLSAGTVLAAGDSNCQVVYGGGEVCQEQVKFTINKLVQAPGKGGSYVENLTVNDARYSAGSNINFKIVIKNTGNTDITNLNVVDRFPEFLKFVAGVGNAQAGASEINFVVGKLEAGKQVEYVITTKAADANSLPANQAITCVTNNVVATATDSTSASDNSQVCIEKSVVTPTPVIMEKPGVKTVPATGPEVGILAGLIPTGIAGLLIRRKVN